MNDLGEYETSIHIGPVPNGGELPELELLNAQLKLLIEHTKLKSVPKGQMGDTEALGRLIASYSKWAGNPICEAFLAALHAANFHTLAEKIGGLVEVEFPATNRSQ